MDMVHKIHTARRVPPIFAEPKRSSVHSLDFADDDDLDECSELTEMGHKVGPRLRESRLLAPSGSGHEFTQPRAHLKAQLCSRPTSGLGSKTQKEYEDASLRCNLLSLVFRDICARP